MRFFFSKKKLKTHKKLFCYRKNDLKPKICNNTHYITSYNRVL